MNKKDVSETPETSVSNNDAAPAPENIEVFDQEVGQDADNEFAPENLRIDLSYLNEPVAKKLLLEMPIRTPSKQDFIRVHLDPKMRLTPAALIKLKDGGEFFLVQQNVLREIDDGEYYFASLFLYINKQKVPAFWPVPLPDREGKINEWHRSAQLAAQCAMKGWVRVVANKSLRGYDVFPALSKYSDPEWPSLPFHELLKLAFQDRIIATLDHPVLLKLRGAD